MHPSQCRIIGLGGGSSQRLGLVIGQVLEQLRDEGDAGEQPIQVARAAVLHANPAGLRNSILLRGILLLFSFNIQKMLAGWWYCLCTQLIVLNLHMNQKHLCIDFVGTQIYTRLIRTYYFLKFD